MVWFVFWATVCKNGSPYAIGPLSCLSVYDVGVLWPNGWTDEDETCHAGRPGHRPHCVRWGPSSTLFPHPKKGGTAPNFRPMSVVAKRLDVLRCNLVWK